MLPLSLLLLQYKLIALAKVGFISKLNYPSLCRAAKRNACFMIETVRVTQTECPNVEGFETHLTN